MENESDAFATLVSYFNHSSQSFDEQSPSGTVTVDKEGEMTRLIEYLHNWTVGGYPIRVCRLCLEWSLTPGRPTVVTASRALSIAKPKLYNLGMKNNAQDDAHLAVTVAARLHRSSWCKMKYAMIISTLENKTANRPPPIHSSDYNDSCFE
ncbi:hypothetical protein PRIPAC_78383 [Pristionchus pacificus]|uniref:Uncharacterized protein n=1 Tax=Pristionchus pacificus TaxID=54126 RepID=A0A2A6BHP1_PRIPA|nr:hypothetical protein PRIPAC_78383 [Pristionchus pacificus]|eukprot:PDM65435.1 hypothetical protein PRIPAC_52377 [Pristionchus pacificus]